MTLLLTGLFGWYPFYIGMNILGVEINFRNLAAFNQIIAIVTSFYYTIPEMYVAAKQKDKLGYLACCLLPFMLNAICYGVIISFHTNLLEKYFLSLLFIFSAAMVIGCWKCIISSTMKFDFNPFTLPWLLPSFFTAAIVYLEFTKLTQFIP